MSEKIYDELEEYLSDKGFRNFRTEVRPIPGAECDFVADKPTPEGQFIRRYVFELKERDFDKVVAQAGIRSNICDYIYIVMVNTNLPYFCYKFGEHFETLTERGVGVLYFWRGEFFKILDPNLQETRENLPKFKQKIWDEQGDGSE